MSPDRVVVATVAVLLGVTLASGPLVGLSLTEADPFEPGTGSATVTVGETPDTATLAPARHGGGVYHLRADSIPLTVESITGQPTIVYEISVPELGHTSATSTFLDSGASGPYDLQFEPATLDAERVDADRYDGTIRVRVFEDESDRVLVETDITVEVAE